jgi:hypothetical protein
LFDMTQFSFANDWNSGEFTWVYMVAGKSAQEMQMRIIFEHTVDDWFEQTGSVAE